MLKLGPITIMKTKQHKAYKLVVNDAYALHTLIWYDGMLTEEGQGNIRVANSILADSISRVPASDIENG